MGLKLTLPKESNGLGYEFTDAYWVIDSLGYTTTADGVSVQYSLFCYPSRESSKMTGMDVVSIGIGRPEKRLCNGLLYIYEGTADAADLFPEGIPISSDMQKTVVYNHIKETTELPFEDVFEDGEMAAVPQEEPVEDPIVDTPADVIEEQPEPQEPEYDPLHL